jgi:hypothetical protein
MANTISSKELRERQDEYTYVDVREADELEEGMIDGAMNIPLGQLIRKASMFDLLEFGVTKNLNHHLVTLRLSSGHYSMHDVRVSIEAFNRSIE